MASSSQFLESWCHLPSFEKPSQPASGRSPQHGMEGPSQPGHKGTIPAPTDATARASNVDNSPVKRVEKPSVPPQNTLLSLSHDASHMVTASKRKFYCLRVNIESRVYELAGWGSGCEDSKDAITAVLCLPVYIPSNGGSITYFVIVGFLSGFMKIFDMSGNIYFSQKWHSTPVKRMKLRAIKSASSVFGESDELIVLYEDKKVICIEGTGLWMTLRNAKTNDSSAPENLSVNYKKWSFASQQEIFDVSILGPSNNSFLSPLSFHSLSGKAFTSSYSARYLAVGKPMIAFYGTTDSVYTQSLAGSMATKVTTAVTSAVFSLAKTFWGSSTAAPQTQDEPVFPSSDITSLIAFNDPQRIISSVSVSPISSAGNLAALTDNLGRVLILDVDQGIIIRIIKGVRDAQIGWILTTLPEDPALNQMPRKALLLAVYSSRGALEIFAMRSGRKVVAIQVERGLKLLQVAHGMLGGAYWRMNTKHEYEYSCFLISSNGEMTRILVPPLSILGKLTQSPQKSDFELLLDGIKQADGEQEREEKFHALLERLSDDLMKNVNTRKKLLSSVSFEEYMAIVQHLIRQHENCKGLDELVKGYRLKSKTRSSVSSPGPLIDLLLQQKLLIYFEGLRNSRANISNESVTQETLDFLRPLFLALLESSKAEEDGFIYTWQSFVEDFNLSPEESEEAPVYLLLKRVNRDALAQLSLILFSECVQEGRRKDLHLHPVSWAGLILSFVTHQEKFHKMDVGVNELAHILKIVHEVLGEANAHDRLLVLELFRDFCISTSLLGPAMLICSSVVFSVDRIDDLEIKRFELENLYKRVRICWFFSQHIQPSTLSELQLTAKSFGETESLCITRLVALHRIQSYKDDDGFGKMSLDFEKELCSAFGYQINSELLQVHLAFEFGRLWHETTDPEWFNRCVLTAGIISNPNLRNVVVLTLFSAFFATKLENTIQVVEKARKTPSGTILMRMSGMKVETSKKFLLNVQSLLEFLSDDAYATSNYMLGSIEEVLNLKPDAPQRPRSFFNGALGMMIEMVDLKAPRRLSSTIIKEHIEVVRILQVIFEYDLKSVRPLKLFRPNTSFCALFFENPFSETDEKDEKVLSERKSFVHKLIEAAPEKGRAWAIDMNWQTPP